MGSPVIAPRVLDCCVHLCSVEDLEDAGHLVYFEALVAGPRIGLIMRVDVHEQIGIPTLRGDDNGAIAIGEIRPSHLGINHCLSERMQMEGGVRRIALKALDKVGHALLHPHGKFPELFQQIAVHHQRCHRLCSHHTTADHLHQPGNAIGL
jgi:hypothetical protein